VWFALPPKTEAAHDVEMAGQPSSPARLTYTPLSSRFFLLDFADDFQPQDGRVPWVFRSIMWNDRLPSIPPGIKRGRYYRYGSIHRAR
jgi:hypothetical protein